MTAFPVCLSYSYVTVPAIQRTCFGLLSLLRSQYFLRKLIKQLLVMYVRLTERIESLIIESSNLTRFIVLFFFVLFFDQVGLSFGSFFNQTLFNLTSIKGKQISYLLLCSGRGCGILCLHICKYSAGKQGDLFSNINVKLIKDFKDFY